MTDYASLIQRLHALSSDPIEVDEAIDAIESLQARVVELEKLAKMEADVYRKSVEYSFDLEAQVATLTQERERIREREAACCPEDVPFDEYIVAMRKDLYVARQERDAARRDLSETQNTLAMSDNMLRAERAAREQAEGMVAALRDAVGEIHGYAVQQWAHDANLHHGTLSEFNAGLKTAQEKLGRVLADTATVATEYRDRIRREALEAPSLSNDYHKTPVGEGFRCAADAIRALLPSQPAAPPDAEP